MVNGVAELFAERAGVFGGDAGHEDALLPRHEFGSDFYDLHGRLARAEDDLRKTFAERTVRVHRRETEVGHRRGLKGVQHLIAADAAGAELFQQFDGFGFGHLTSMAERRGGVTQKWL